MLLYKSWENCSTDAEKRFNDEIQICHTESWFYSILKDLKYHGDWKK